MCEHAHTYTQPMLLQLVERTLICLQACVPVPGFSYLSAKHQAEVPITIMAEKIKGA